MAEGMRIGSIEVHPAANLFPEMGDEDLGALAQSIKDHGLRNPLVFFDGRLLDGRNRVRAAVVAGLNTERLPRRNLPSDVDPYMWAWDANCSRLDYTPSQKAAVRIKVEEESGELARRRAEVAAEANRARAERLADVPRDSRPPRGGSLSEPKPPHRTVAKEIAERAHVSPRTVERVQKLKREDPAAFETLATKGRLPAGHPLLAKRKQPKNWSVPRAIPALAAFLWERLPSTERLDLARRLTEDAP